MMVLSTFRPLWHGDRRCQALEVALIPSHLQRGCYHTPSCEGACLMSSAQLENPKCTRVLNHPSQPHLLPPTHPQPMGPGAAFKPRLSPQPFLEPTTGSCKSQAAPWESQEGAAGTQLRRRDGIVTGKAGTQVGLTAAAGPAGST